MEDNMEISLFDTKVDDMTVGDALKINGIVLAGMAALGFAAAGLALLPDKVRTFKQNRKYKKLAQEVAPTEEV